MSIYSDASIILPQDPYRKAGVIYALKPIDGTADFTVVRASVANEINSDGLIEEVVANMPRFDYTDGTCPSLLLEPQSTNLITYPLSFDNASWTKSGATVVSGQDAPSVDNPTSAFKIVEDTSTALHQITKTASTSVETKYTLSIRVKGTDRNIAIQYYSYQLGATVINVNFNLVSGVITTTTGTNGKITALADGFYEISASSSIDVLVGTGLVYIRLEDGITKVYTGDGTSGVYIFGAQLEALSYATSLMLPVTEGSTTTRLKDEVSKSGLSSYINSVEGTLFVEMAALADDGTNRIITISDGSLDNSVWVTYTTVSNNIRYVLKVDSVDSALLDTVVSDVTQNSKIAVTWKLNEFKVFIDGVKTGEDLSGGTFADGILNTLEYQRSDATLAFYGKNKQLQVYKTALSDAELVTLTTL